MIIMIDFISASVTSLPGLYWCWAIIVLLLLSLLEIDRSVRLTGTTDVMWSYEIDFHRSDVRWASRWNIYLEMSDLNIHWFSVINSVIVVFFLAGQFYSRFANIVCMSQWRRYLWQGAYNSGKRGNLGEFVNSGKLRETSGNLKYN